MTMACDLYVARLRFFLTIVLGLNLLFFRYLSKIDARTHLRLYFKHICVVLFNLHCCFSIFQENYLCAAKNNNFGSYPSFDPLDQANSRRFLTYVIKVDKREVLRLYFKHIHVILLFLVFSGKLPLCSESE